MENSNRKKIGRYIDAVYDPGFKALFCNKRYPFVAKSFINSILPEDRQITTIKFVDRELEGYTIYNKSSRTDFHCTDQYNREFIVEMQIAEYDFFYLRTMYYASRVFVSNLLPSQKPNYGELNPVYIISLLTGDLKEPEFKDNKSVLNWFRMYDIENKIVAPNGINCIFVSLKNVPNSYEVCKNYFEKFCLLIKSIGDEKRNPEEVAGGQFESILRAAEVEKLLPQERNEYETDIMLYYDYELGLDQKFKDGKLEGMAEGKAEGKTEGKLEMAKSLLSKGIDINIISSCSGLSIEQLQGI